MADRAVALLAAVLAEPDSDAARKGHAAYGHVADRVLAKRWVDDVDCLLSGSHGG